MQIIEGPRRRPPAVKNSGAIIRPLRAGFEYAGLAYTTGYDKLNPNSPRHDPNFPKPVPVGGRAKGLLRAELDAWLAAKARERNAEAA